LPGVSSSVSHVARTAYEAFLADLRRQPSAAECERWATNHAGDPDEPRALVDAGWSIARSGGDIELALELFRRAAGFGGEFGRDAQVGIAEQLYTLHRDQEADEVQRALRAELDDQPGGLGIVRIFDDMTEMLSDAGQDQLALEWCQAGLDRAAEAGDDPEVEELRRGLLISRYYLREKLGIELDDEDRAAYAEADSSVAELTAMMRERLGPLRPDSNVDASHGDGAFDAIVLRWTREDFRTVLSRWPESTSRYGDDYETYAGQIQREAGVYEESGATRVRLVTGSLTDYEAYAKAQQRDPAAPSTRRDYGEWCTTARPDRVRLWPPERNGACWCDSGRKYKKCCGAPARN
jgi:SEC-C motif